MEKGLIYKVIHTTNVDDLNREVNNNLGKGWVMYGYPIIVDHNSLPHEESKDFYQAMVTERKDK